MTVLQLNPTDRVLLALAAVCTGVLGTELLWPQSLQMDVSHSQGPDRETPAAQTPPHKPARMERDYASIAERPLFTADRRPYRPPPEEPVDDAPPTPTPPRIEFELSAIVRTGETSIALLRANDSQDVIKLALGEEHAGWTLTDVLAETVVLSDGRRSATVELRAKGTAAARNERANR